MPVALLLQQDFQRLARAARPLDHWREVLVLEALVIDRARGAFLSTWFGATLPRSGDAVSIGIGNIAALGEQFRRARAQSIGGDTGANLAEPLAGMAGMAAGILFSPSGSILALYGLLRTATGTLPWVLFNLLFNTGDVGGALSLAFAGVVMGVGVAAGAVLLPVGFIGAILYIAFNSGRPGTGQLAYELLGALARLFQALPRLVAQLLGPREGVRNPLIASILGLFDRLAALMAQGIGAMAWLVTRVFPLILPWTREFLAIGQLAVATIDLVKTILEDAKTRLFGLFDASDPNSLASIAGRLIDHTVAGVMQWIDAVGQAMDQLDSAIRTGARAAIAAAGGNIRGMIAVARKLVMNFPLITTFRALAAVAAVVRSIPPAPPRPVSSPGLFSMFMAMLPASSGPSFPTWPGLPDAALVEGMVGERPLAPTKSNVDDLLDPGSLLGSGLGRTFIGLPPDSLAPFRLTPETRQMIERLTRAPASIVADQLAALAAEQANAPNPVIDADHARGMVRLLMGILPADIVAAAVEEEAELRTTLHARIVDTVLPAVTAYIPALRPMLQALDETITARAETDLSAFPVRSLPDNGRLRPVIGRLTVVLPGGDAATARNFAADLTRLMRNQPYVAAA